MSLKTLTLIKKLSISFSLKNFVIRPSTSHRTNKDRVAILEKTHRASEIHATSETGSNFPYSPRVAFPPSLAQSIFPVLSFFRRNWTTRSLTRTHWCPFSFAIYVLNTCDAQLFTRSPLIDLAD